MYTRLISIKVALLMLISIEIDAEVPKQLLTDCTIYNCCKQSGNMCNELCQHYMDTNADGICDKCGSKTGLQDSCCHQDCTNCVYKCATLCKEEKDMRATLRYLYGYANDLAAMRQFYTGLLGLKENLYNADNGWLCYECDGFDIMFFREPNAKQKMQFSEQPGWNGGVLTEISWSIQVSTEDFPKVVKSLRDAGVKMVKKEPEWRQDSYWGISVMDPMGNTVEVFCLDNTE